MVVGKIVGAIGGGLRRIGGVGKRIASVGGKSVAGAGKVQFRVYYSGHIRLLEVILGMTLYLFAAMSYLGVANLGIVIIDTFAPFLIVAGVLITIGLDKAITRTITLVEVLAAIVAIVIPLAPLVAPSLAKYLQVSIPSLDANSLDKTSCVLMLLGGLASLTVVASQD